MFVGTFLGLSRKEKHLIVRLHNKHRGDLEQYGQPEPSNMLKMVIILFMIKLLQKFISGIY